MDHSEGVRDVSREKYMEKTGSIKIHERKAFSELRMWKLLSPRFLQKKVAK